MLGDLNQDVILSVFVETVQLRSTQMRSSVAECVEKDADIDTV